MHETDRLLHGAIRWIQQSVARIDPATYKLTLLAKSPVPSKGRRLSRRPHLLRHELAHVQL